MVLVAEKPIEGEEDNKTYANDDHERGDRSRTVGQILIESSVIRGGLKGLHNNPEEGKGGVCCWWWLLQFYSKFTTGI